MITLTLSFFECEHEGDLDNYAHDVQESGGRILASRLNDDDETGIIRFEVGDKEEFRTRFKTTDSYEFSSIAY